MHQRIQISGGLLASLLLIFTLVSQMLYLPATLVNVAGQAAWLAVLLGNIGGGLVGLLGVALSLRFPRMMPAEIARQVAGRWFGGLLGLLYGLLFLWLYGVTLRDVIDWGQVVLLPETPGTVVGFMIAAVVLYVAWEGLEPIARLAFPLLLVMILSQVFMPLALWKDVSLLQVEPLVYHGFGPLLRATGYALPWFVESLIVTVLVPNLRPGDRAYRWFLVGVGGCTVLFMMLVALLTLVFGPDLPGRLTYPIYSLVQLITIGRTIGRIEIVLAAIWIAALFIKLTLCLYATTTALTDALGLKNAFRKTALLVTLLGLLLPRFLSGPLAVIYLTRTRPWIIGTVAFALAWPGLLLLLSLRRAPAAKEAVHG